MNRLTTVLSRRTLQTSRLIALRKSSNRQKVLITRVNTQRFMIFNSNILVIISITQNILQKLPRHLRQFLILVLITKKVVVLDRRNPFIIFNSWISVCDAIDTMLTREVRSLGCSWDSAHKTCLGRMVSLQQGIIQVYRVVNLGGPISYT